MPKAKAKKVRKVKKELSWDEQMLLIIQANGAGSAIEEASGLGELETSFETDEEELVYLNDRYTAETEYMTCVISDLIDRLHAVVAAAGLTALPEEEDDDA